MQAQYLLIIVMLSDDDFGIHYSRVYYLLPHNLNYIFFNCSREPTMIIKKRIVLMVTGSIVAAM